MSKWMNKQNNDRMKQDTKWTMNTNMKVRKSYKIIL